MTTVRVCQVLNAECPHPGACHYFCVKQMEAMSFDDVAPNSVKPDGPVYQMYRQKTEAERGWQCPVCKKVHAPFVPGCNCHEATRP